MWSGWMFGTIHHPPTPPPLVTEKFWKGASMPIYIGWCFLDLNWTFYRALLPIYIKNDTVVLVAHHARTAILTDSCQVFVLILYLCNDSVLITFILWSLPCPKVSNRWGSHHFVVKSTNEIWNMQMYVCMTDNCIGLKHNFNCICYLSPSVYIVITALSQCTWNAPITLLLCWHDIGCQILNCQKRIR